MSIRWLRANAEKYGIDPTRVIAWGSSAGGQIADIDRHGLRRSLVVAAAHRRRASYRGEARLCVRAGRDRLVRHHRPDFECRRTWAEQARPRKRANRLIWAAKLQSVRRSCSARRPHSPISISETHRFLFSMAHADTSVSAKQSQRLHDALRKAGVSSELILYPNVDHGFAAVPGGGPDDAVNRQAMKRTFTNSSARHFPSTR